MGRGGGSHGGGGHSGGRSFGGRSGGFGGSHGGGRGPGGPGFGGPGFGGPPPGGPGFGGPGGWGPRWGGPRRRWRGPIFPGGGFGGPGGCSTIILLVIIILAVISCVAPDWGSSRQDIDVTVSRTERTAVTGTKTYSDWYLDELGFIDHDTDLIDGLKYFYSKTGIQPYVMLLDYDESLWDGGNWNEDAAEQYLAQVYADTFSDNGHLIFAYFACENDTEDMDGMFYFYYGSAAYSIMDDEAETIFWSYFDMNYNNLDLSIAEFIGQTFEETADNIMHVGTSGNSTLIKAAAVFAVICAAAIIIGIVVAKRAAKKDNMDQL